jgi:hypothetical protein
MCADREDERDACHRSMTRRLELTGHIPEPALLLRECTIAV